jgi:glycosyltransferase involved in cell wall biosynthesis
MAWTACQLGSREHYAIPAALQQAGELRCLMTDAWVSERMAAWLGPWLPGLASRRSSAIPDYKVEAWTFQRLVLDAQRSLAGASEWTTIIKRNAAFGAWTAKRVHTADSTVLFSYSYTALQPFLRFRGRKVLGQIDPGPREQEVVAEAAKSYESLALPESGPPSVYWDLWRKEINLADRIVVNSAWSARLLSESGVARAKMVEIPLVYEPAKPEVERRQSSVFSYLGFGRGPSGGKSKLATRHSPPVSGSRPRLQALFLGSIILRKGVGQLFDAIRQLRNEPVDFTFAGPLGVRIPDDIRGMANVSFLGPVDRRTGEQLYAESDVFLFPTLSDGFGLTQLEALGHGLPVIASTNCGQVVEDRVNGLLLAEVLPEVIADGIMSLVKDRDFLTLLKSNARVPDECHPRHLAQALVALQ